MEHRWGDRVPSNGAVKLVGHPASIGWGRFRDISMTGAFIETKLELCPLSKLNLAATVASPSGRGVFQMSAVVVRRNQDGIGVEWLDGNLDAVAAIVREARTALQEPSRLRQTRETMQRSS